MKLRRFWHTPWSWHQVPRPFVRSDWTDKRSCFICIGIGAPGVDYVWALEWGFDLTPTVADGRLGRVITWFGRRS